MTDEPGSVVQVVVVGGRATNPPLLPQPDRTPTEPPLLDPPDEPAPPPPPV